MTAPADPLQAAAGVVAAARAQLATLHRALMAEAEPLQRRPRQRLQAYADETLGIASALLVVEEVLRHPEGGL